MSLRRRLMITSVVLAALGLVLSGISTFAALRDWQSQAHDRTLSQIGRQAAEVIGDKGLVTAAAPVDDVNALWRSQAVSGGIPSFFQIRAADDRVLQTVQYGAAPSLDARPRPGRVSRGNPDGERFWRVDGDGENSSFSIRTAWLPDGNRFLIIAIRTPPSGDVVPRVVGSLTVFGLLALVGVAMLAGIAVKRGLRPLEAIADTAGAIGAGDLAQRVDTVDPRTEVGRLGKALNDMLGQIEAAFRERMAAENKLRRFVADASHELRTPVATVRGYAELFRRGAASRPEDLGKAMARIESEAERMGVLVDELLLLARLDQGRPLERRPVDLAVIAAETVADARAVDPGRPLELEGEGPLVVTGDSDRLRQVVVNLLANVRQHTPPGTAATVRLTARPDRAVLEVADEGPGLSESEVDRAFERFFRAGSTRGKDNGGAGLGLSIVAAVVEAHGGQVSMHSEPDSGACVRVVLPLGESPTADDDQV